MIRPNKKPAPLPESPFKGEEGIKHEKMRWVRDNYTRIEKYQHEMDMKLKRVLAKSHHFTSGMSNLGSARKIIDKKPSQRQSQAGIDLGSKLKNMFSKGIVSRESNINLMSTDRSHSALAVHKAPSTSKAASSMSVVKGHPHRRNESVLSS